MDDCQVLQAIIDSLANLDATREHLAANYPVKADREICSALLKLNVVKTNLEKRLAR